MTEAVLPARPVASTRASVSLAHVALAACQLALIAVSYYVAARIGLGFRFQNSQIGVVWPPNAVLLAALLLTPRSRWWRVLVVASLAHIVVMTNADVPAWRWIWQLVANSVLATGMAVSLQHLAGTPLDFGSRRQVFAFTALSFAGPAIFTVFAPAFVRSFLGLEPVYSPPYAFLLTMLSNTAAILLIVPFVIMWGQYGRRRLYELGLRGMIEAGVIIATLVGVGLVAFGTGPAIARFPTLLLWIFPPLVWAAVRLGPMGVSTSLFCVAALSTWGTAEQLGPFVLTSDATQVLSLQLFWIVIGPPIMLLAAVIREREQVEEMLHEQRNQLAHVTRVATAGELSGAIAHELRQPLMAILANAQAGIILLDRNPGKTDEVRQILQDIVQQDQQASGVITQLRSFLKDGESQLEPVDIDDVVRDALALSRSTVEMSRVTVETDIASDLPRVSADAVQILQVMVNLIVNACEAMSLTPTTDRQLTIRVATLGPEQVEIAVTDRGSGLPNGDEDRVFRPFFTTKPKGLGLGLAISRSIVAAHGGRLWAENNLRRGATFHLVLAADGARHSSPVRARRQSATDEHAALVGPAHLHQ